MSRIKGKSRKTPTPFSAGVHKTERTVVAILMHWMREIIKEKNIGLGMPDVETSGKDRKMPDLVIYESPRSKKVLCVIEAKPPGYDVFNEEELKEPARKKATKRRAKYFATTDFRRLIWFDTKKVNDMLPEEEQIVDRYTLSEIWDMNDVEQTKYSAPIKRGLEEFLRRLYGVFSGKEPVPKLAIDELLILHLQNRIDVLSIYYRRIIEDQCNKEVSFRKELQKWFSLQGWNFACQPRDFDKAARQTAYLLTNKILFYNVLQAKRPRELDELEIPESLTKPDVLKDNLQSYFRQILKIDYETIYSADFIDSLAFPKQKEVVAEIKELINILKRYDFSKLGFDVIGRIFERLIPAEERHNLGQYFTSPDVVDFILGFCLQHEDDRILDPSCGSGTFLVRAYQAKQLMNQRLEHEKILETLWGCDIAKFPAHLATINLAINDLGVDRNYPNILHEDFFNLLVEKDGFEAPGSWRKARAVTLGIGAREIVYPKNFDAVVGNPPYTKQEEIPETGVDKSILIKNALTNHLGEKIADISERAGIHAYFFVHGMKFLRDEGFFGFIVSNSWLDTDYGKGLQLFFIEHYKIIAIIESKIERWFEDADINTCLVILQKCKDKRKRDSNPARFVYLKRPLRHFMPLGQEIWEKQKERQSAILKLIRTILAHDEYYENEDLKIHPVKQKELFKEGFSSNKQRYVGAKWGKYLRISLPDIFFRIMNKGENVFVKLQNIADVKPGCYTGINDFFYVERRPEYKNLIEKEFLKPAIRSTRQVKTVFMKTEDINSLIFVCRLSKKELRESRKRNTLRYINWGQKEVTRKRQKVDEGILWPKVETVKNRKIGWWAIPPKETLQTQVFMIYVINDKFIAINSDKPMISDRCFHRLFLKEGYQDDIVTAILNSTMTIFNIEIYGRSNLGLGALKFEAMDAKQIPVIDTKKIKDSAKKKIRNCFKKFKDREIGNIFQEIGAKVPDDVSLDKVKPDRRDLDKIIMGEILGFTDKEQLEIYRAVVDLVNTRISRAKSGKKKRTSRDGIDVDKLKGTIVERINQEQGP